MSDTRTRPNRTVVCRECEQEHVAEFSHVSEFGGHDVYAVVCTVDHLTDYYTEEGLKPE